MECMFLHTTSQSLLMEIRVFARLLQLNYALTPWYTWH